MSPKVSIIVPVYNVEQYLPSCIDSILSQSYYDFELILVDDGSTDGSGVVCDTYAQKDGRIRVFHKKNGGASSARNVGIVNVTGEWLCFVDADDELLPNGLKVMVEGISDGINMVMAGYKIYDEKGSLVYSIKEEKSCLKDKESTAKEMYAPSDFWYQGYIWGKLLKVLEIKKHNILFFEDVYFNEDRLFLTQFICETECRAFYTTIPVYKYFERLGSAMMSLKKSFNPKFVTDLEAQIRMRQLVRDCCDEKILRDLADYETFKSYQRIVGMMKEFEYKDDSLRLVIRRKLVDAIGVKAYAFCEMKWNMHRAANKLSKLKTCKNS